MSGRQALPGLGAYAASKFALEGLTESLRHELRPFGARAVLIEPGPYKTDIFDRNRWIARQTESDPGEYARFYERMKELVASSERRMGDAREVADLVVRLLLDPDPKLRYPLGPGVAPRLAIRALLPFEIVERLLQRAIGRVT